MRPLFLILLSSVGFVSCSISHTSASRSGSANGFEAGKAYEARQPVALTRMGTVDMLSPTGARGDAPVVGQIPAGTRIQVQRIETYHPGTHGPTQHPVGEILDGPLKGRTVQLARTGLRGEFTEATPR